MSCPVRIFVSAGEVSGDQILARILSALRSRLPGATLEICGLGGRESEREGLAPLLPLARTAVSGVGDVLASAVFLARMRRRALRLLEGTGDRRPDLALLVDYPGLNLGLARRARERGIPVVYVAPPQAWLYRKAREKAAKARRALEGAAVVVLYPFETGLFAEGPDGEAGPSSAAFGHFLDESMEIGTRRRAGGGEDLLLLCPGSRLPALRRNLPAWLGAFRGAGILPAMKERTAMGITERNVCGPAKAAVLAPPHLEGEVRALAERSAGEGPVPEILVDKAEALRRARWAVAFPGTITLELALAGVPAAVAAALDPLTLAVGRRAIRGPWLGLPNLLLGTEAFPEWAGRPAGLGAAAAGLWERLRAADGPGAAARLRELLGPPRGAGIAADACLKILEKS
jgi:lipid-A-disaccharide synthase